MTENVYYKGHLLSSDANKFEFSDCMIVRAQDRASYNTGYYISYDGINWDLAHNGVQGFYSITGMPVYDTSLNNPLVVNLPGSELKFISLGTELLTNKGEIFGTPKQTVYKKTGSNYYSAMINTNSVSPGVTLLDLSSGQTSTLSASIFPNRLASNGSEVIVVGWNSYRLINSSNTISSTFSNPDSSSMYFYAVEDSWFAYGYSGGQLYSLSDYNSSTGFTWTLLTTLPTGLSDLIIVKDETGTILIDTPGSGQVYRSTDDGDTWATVTLPTSVTCASLGYFNGYFYLFGEKSSQGIVYRSVDGSTWSEVVADLPIKFMENRCVVL